jgi:5,10-methylenetetrahydrofolate reductase
VDSIGLVRIIDRFNEGVDLAGQEMGHEGRLHHRRSLRPDARRPGAGGGSLPSKVSGGAHFTMTQPIFDPQLWVNFVRVYEERHGQFPVPVLIGVLPLQGHKHATFLHNEVPGITLSETRWSGCARPAPMAGKKA